MSELLDQAGEVREADALDISALSAFLQQHVEGLNGELNVRQFAGGASNLTYQLSMGGRDMILRRPPSGTKPKSGHDMAREFKVLTALQGHFAPAPKPLVFCDDPSVIGAEFYVMEKLSGIIVRRDLPKGMALSEADAGTLCRNLIGTLAELHQVDFATAGLADLGRPEGYVARQVSGWNGRYAKARTDDVPENPQVMAWLEAKQPPDGANPGIIHNDYKLDNVVLDPADPLQVIGVLDWEMTTLGDPLMDLGSTLAYWVEAGDPPYMQLARMMPTTLPGMFTRDEVIAHYAQLTGRNMDHFDFYYTFGLFRLAVIAQQIYYRYYHGQTTNKRFEAFGQMVGLLIQRTDEIISKSEL